MDLNLSKFDTSVDCIKGKMIIKIMDAKADRCIDLFGIIHTYIYGSFTPLVIGDHKYFITFINDHSCYGFVELILEKFDFFETFKYFKVRIQFIHSVINGKYYDRYNER